MARIQKKVLQWDDLLAADGGVSFEKVQRVRMKLQEQEELAGETYAEAQRYHQIDPVTGTHIIGFWGRCALFKVGTISQHPTRKRRYSLIYPGVPHRACTCGR
jgi:hypothetical protein